MSLINEVLRNLDQKGATAGYRGTDLPPNLRPDRVQRTPRLVRWGLIIAVAIAGGAGVGAGAYWLFDGEPAEDGGGDETAVAAKAPPEKGVAKKDDSREPANPLLVRFALWDWPDAPPLPVATSPPETKQKAMPLPTVSAGSEATKLRIAPPRRQHPRVSKVVTYPKGKRWPVSEGERKSADEKQRSASASKTASTSETGKGSAPETSPPEASREGHQDAESVAGSQRGPQTDSGKTKQEPTVAKEASGDNVVVQLHPQTRRRREGEQLASRGYAALQAGRLNEAVSLLRAARQRLPARSGVANNLALALWKKEQSAEAIRVLQGLLQRDTENERIARNLGHFLLSAPQAGPREAARKTLAEAAVQQDAVSVYILAGRVLHQDGRPGQAAELLQLGEQRLGGPWRLAYERGRALAAAKRIDDARKAFQKALDSLPPRATDPRQRVRSALERMKGRD